MKVKIGKYPSRLTCNIYSDYMFNKYGLNWSGPDNKFEYVLDKLEDFIQSVYNIFNRIWFDERTQKINVKIDSWDTWSMDHTLAHIILPMLKQLKETKHGSPLVDDEDVPHLPKKQWSSNESSQLDLFESEEQDTLFWDQYEVRWAWVLGEMIFAFDSKINDDWEEQFETGTSDIQWKTLEGGMSQMVRGPNDTKEYDWEGRKKYQERISNGFRLFGKYYEGLWD